MPAQQWNGFRGLGTAISPHAANQAALSVADNVLIREPGVIEPRPGFPAVDGNLDGVFVPFVHSYGGHVFAFSRTDGMSPVWHVERVGGSAITGIPSFTSQKIAVTNTRGGMLVAGNDGVYVLRGEDSTSMRRAGMPRSLPFTTLALTSSLVGGGAMFTANPQWRAFRTVLATRYGDFEILGAPSNYDFIGKSIAAERNLALVQPLPPEVLAGDFLQIYATDLVPTSEQLGDTMFMIHEHVITAAEITAGEVTGVLYPGNSINGPALYTNATQEGGQSANERPPYCTTIWQMHGITFYAGGQKPPYAVIREVVSLPGPGVEFVAGQEGMDVTSGSTAAEFAGPFAFPDVAGMVVYDRDDGSDVARTTNPLTIDGFSLQANTRIVSNDVDTYEVVLSKAALSTDSSRVVILCPVVTLGSQEYVCIGARGVFGYDRGWGDDSDTDNTNPLRATRSFCNTINRDPAGEFYAWPISVVPVTTPDTVLGEQRGRCGIEIYARNPAAAQFTVAVTPPGVFNLEYDQIPKLGYEDGGPNLVYYSKLYEPESVPPSNFFRVGNADAPVLRGLTARDSSFVFTEDGVYQLFGFTPEELTLQESLQLVRLLTPNSATQLGGSIFAMTDHGVFTMTDQGVQNISVAAIDDQLAVYQRALLAAPHTEGVFSFSHPIHNYVGFALRTSSITSSDASPEKVFVFCQNTGSWVTWTPTVGSGEWNSAVFHKPVGRLYMAGYNRTADAGGVFLESVPTATMPMFASDGSPETVTISSIDGTARTITFSSPLGGVNEGKGLVQGSATTVLRRLVSGATWEVFDTTGFTAASASLHTTVLSTVAPLIVTAGDPNALKNYYSFTAEFQSADLIDTVSCVYTSNISSTPETVTESLLSSASYGTGFRQPRSVDLGVPRNHARAAQLRPQVRIPSSFGAWRLTSMVAAFNPATTGGRVRRGRP